MTWWTGGTERLLFFCLCCYQVVTNHKNSDGIRIEHYKSASLGKIRLLGSLSTCKNDVRIIPTLVYVRLLCHQQCPYFQADFAACLSPPTPAS